MKKILFLALIFINMSAFAQMDSSENTPTQLVKEFFKAFHAQDTVTLKKFAHDGARLESVSIDAEGNTKLTTDNYSKFLKNIASIPAEATFEERIHEYRVEENGSLATVTTPYTLYFNGKLYHCGVNSFQLVKFNGEWKIVYLIDTRVKEGCD
ncbi:nuclear transport factor 2 family protein [Gramella jeungdoensis]|uniref:Nuclear transport factor 2 family protein n=1 Tax=Gramella jeungdoensis TaxID=708091 RepID=A0ABT0Z4A4_9FLAO|nr:nuclear transport factor 2 family protein [Gramella jeungdoensis]MCM8570559.1 nuclear transport factor 2 family protein [Gramella jeungdoensis]